nr:hypothetical protein [Enterovibrio nigricans]
MSQVTFDTLKFVESLEKAGIPKEQAKAISTAFQESHEALELATKRDLQDLQNSTKRDLQDLRNELDNKIDKLGLQLTIRLGV